jgi:RimJ/RimL family protein N-acetyltransferase
VIAVPPAPTLQTKRLVLRPFRPEDLEVGIALWTDAVVYRHILGRPNTREECWARLLRYNGHWDWLGYGFWAIEHRQSAKVIGEVGFADFQRTLDPPMGDRIEMGWVLSPEFHGRGLAQEAATAALHWASTNLPARTQACMINEANTPSLHLAARLGFAEAIRATYHGDAVVILHRDPASLQTM